jgi:selenocysteine lyase/cysteine desulfurase
VSERTPTFCFNLSGWEPRPLAGELAARGIHVWDGDYYALAPMRALGLAERGAVRAGFLHYTTPEEVDRLVAALAELQQAPPPGG